MEVTKVVKVIIVDDEEWIRLGLKIQVDWNSLGIEIIGEAQNGTTAIEIIEDKMPDIVITDIRMPKMDGIALMEYINKRYPSIIIIIISGYSDFEYARKAISFSVFDYILKPIEKEVLEKTLKKAVEKLKEEENRRLNIINLKAKLNENSSLLKEKILTDFVLGLECDSKDIRRSIESIGLNFQWPRMVILVFKVANFDAITSSVYDNDVGLASFAISNVIEELILDTTYSVIFRNYTKQDELILIKGFNTDEYAMIIENVYTVCNNIIETVMSFLEFQIYIGIGGEFTNLNEAGKSYSQAVEAVQNAGIMDRSRIIHFDEISSRNEYFIYPDDKEKAFLYYLENGYKTKANDLIEILFEEIGKSETITPQSIKRTVLELTISISKMLKKHNCYMEELIGERNIAGKIMNEIFTVNDLKDWLKAASNKVLDFIAGNRKLGSRKIINQIADYVTMHYSEGINLNGISEQFYINPAYLSRIFKNEIGQNFNDFLSKIRMDAAVKLLEQGDLKMSNISEMVGYENVNYFLKKFKEYFNCTPTEYRKKHL